MLQLIRQSFPGTALLAVLLAAHPACMAPSPLRARNGNLVGESGAVPGKPLPLVQERFVSVPVQAENLDSIAVFADGQPLAEPLAICTAKAGDQLVLFNALSGERKGTVGSRGSSAGQFARPNGILVLGNLCWVVERDNHRVQVLRLPDFSPLALIGGDILRKPYGIAGFQDDAGRFQLFVTDDYGPIPPGVAEGDFFKERVKHLVVKLQGEGLQLREHRSFGAVEGAGVLFKVESILVDPQRDRLFLSIEKGPNKGVVVYRLNGTFSGLTLAGPRFLGEPEGLAFAQVGGRECLVATDQQPKCSDFHLFDRETLTYLGGFRAARTSNTDGIAVFQNLPALSQGGLWAIHDDSALALLAWSDIAHALGF
jgi:3-phytase